MKSFTKFLAFSFLMVALSFQVRVASANQDAEVKLAEKYLVKLTTGNRPACLWNENYMVLYGGVQKEYIGNVRELFKNWSLEKQPEEGGFKNDRLFCAFVTKDDTFKVYPYPDPDNTYNTYQDLFSLIKKDDSGEAITTLIAPRQGEKYLEVGSITIRYATNDKMKNVPIIVDSINKNGYSYGYGYGYNEIINLKAKMVDEDLDKYFYEGVEKTNQYPSVGLCWTTTWDDLKRRWEDLKKSEVIEQIRIISESGRFERPGGKAWKDRIDGFYKEKSLYPSFTIINSTGVDCEGEIEWVNSITRKSVAKTPISVIKDGWSSKVNIPFEEFAKLNDGETLSPTVRFWAPNNPCCGKIERKSVVQFEKYGKDLEYTVNKEASESWLSETNATIFGQINNLKGRSCVVEFNGKMSDLTHNGTFTFSVAAHRGGKLSVKENGIEVAYLEIKGDDLHKATNKSYELSLPDKAKPKLAKVDDIEFPKDGLFTLSINNGLGGVVFNGKLDDYENGASIKDRLVNVATNIPVSISDGRDIQEILDSYLTNSIEISSGWVLVRQANGYIISYNGHIPNGKYLELPKTLKVVNIDECIEAILQLKKQPVEKRKLRTLMKNVSGKMPSWTYALIVAARENNFAAAIELKNNTRRDLFVDGLTGKIAVNSSVRLSGENIDTIKIREDEYSFEEYEDSSNIISIKSFNPLGDDQSISISEETLVKKRATKVLFKDAKDINVVTISYSDNKSYSYSSKKNIADGIELRMHIDISNIEIKWINGKTTSVRLPKSWYRYGEGDITITDTMPSEPKPEPELEKDQETKKDQESGKGPEPKPDKVKSSCSKCGTELNNDVCTNCTKAPDKGRITLKLRRFARTLKRPEDTVNYNPAMESLQEECTNAQRDGLTLKEFKECCKGAGIPEEAIEKLK